MRSQFSALSLVVKQFYGHWDRATSMASLDNIGEANITLAVGEHMQNYTFVLDTNKRPLDPVHPAHARRLLSTGKAAVYRRYPFTIIMKDVSTTTPTQPLVLKLDPGSKTTGVAILKGSKLIFVAELVYRGHAINLSLQSRRSIRSDRRSRQTRYRPARYLNRARPKGWLPPSLQHRVLTTMTWVKKFIRYAPITSIAQELVRFDIQKMDNPEISGVEYQQGTLLGYEVREYLLNKWDRKCTYCKAEGVPLQVEHIHPRSKGGSNRASNLCLACTRCNLEKGTQDIKDFLSKKPELLKQVLSQAKRPLKDAAAVNTTRWALLTALKGTGLPVTTGSGGLTKYNRVRLGLPKTHYYDAACVGTTAELTVLASQPLNIKANGHGSQQMCRTDKYGFPSRYVPRYKYVKGFQTGDIVKAVVTKGKKVGTYVGRVAVRSTGYFNISNQTLMQGIKYKYCNILHRKDGYSYYF